MPWSSVVTPTLKFLTVESWEGVEVSKTLPQNQNSAILRKVVVKTLIVVAILIFAGTAQAQQANDANQQACYTQARDYVTKKRRASEKEQKWLYSFQSAHFDAATKHATSSTAELMSRTLRLSLVQMGCPSQVQTTVS